MSRPPRGQVTDLATAHGGVDVYEALEVYDERAAIREYEGGMGRADAETAAVGDVQEWLSGKLRNNTPAKAEAKPRRKR